MRKRDLLELTASRVHEVFNKVLTVKEHSETFMYRLGDAEHMAIYSIWIDDIEWFEKNAVTIATNVCILEIGSYYKSHQLSIDAFKTRQKLDVPIYFEPAEIIRITIRDARLISGLPVIHLFGLSSESKLL